MRKRIAVLLALASLCGMLAGCAEEEKPYEKPETIINLYDYAGGITAEELVALKGEPEEIEDSKRMNQTTDEQLPAKKYYYDGGVLRFTIVDDVVIGMQFDPDEPISFKDAADLAWFWGIDPAKATVTMNQAQSFFYEVQDPYIAVQCVEVDTKNKTSGYVDFTFDENY